MKRLLALATITLAAATAQAATTLTLPAFTITQVDTYSTFNIGLISDVSGLTRIDGINSNIDIRSWTSTSGDTGTLQAAVYRIDVQSGYRVSEIDFSGLFNGIRVLGEAPGYTPGYASNSLRAGLQILSGLPQTAGSDVLFDQLTKVKNLDGSSPFVVTAGDLSLTGSFYVQSFNSLTIGAAPSTLQVCHPDGSPCRQEYAYVNRGGAGFSDMGLSIHTQPVPEPSIYAMLMAGLALLGFGLRRRQA